MMNEQELREEIYDIFDSMSTSELVDCWNEYCRDYSDYEHYIYYREEFDDRCQGMSPLEIVKIANGADIDGHDYFWEDIYGVEVGDYAEDLPISIEDLVSYCIECNKSMGIPDIDELLDEFFYQQDEEEDE